MSGSSRDEVSTTTGSERVRSSALSRRSTSRPSTLGSFKSSRTTRGTIPISCQGYDPDLVPGVTAVAEKEVERFGAVASHEYLVRNVTLLERAQRQLLVVRVVLDQQDLDFVREIHAQPGSGRVGKREALVAATTPGHDRGAARPKWAARPSENRVASRLRRSSVP